MKPEKQDKMENGTNMGVKVYNIAILLADIIILIVRWWYYSFEAIYRKFVPIEECSVKDEIVFITGTGHGIGKEIALKYAELGSKVICVDINEKNNLETVKEIKARGGKSFAYVCDVSNREKIFELKDKIKKEVGDVSIVINNAGIMPTHSLLLHTEEEIQRIFGINVFAHFWILQAFIPDMIKNNKGHIVALSSVAGLLGLGNLVPYCGSKFAVRGIMESFSEEIRTDPRKPNIHFTTVMPYMVDTGLCKKPYMRFENLMSLVKPHEAAEAIVSAQRRKLDEFTIPQYLFYLNTYTRLFPRACGSLLRDFLDSGVESDL